MNHIHLFIKEILQNEKICYLRINIISHGGISRIRAWGK